MRGQDLLDLIIEAVQEHLLQQGIRQWSVYERQDGSFCMAGMRRAHEILLIEYMDGHRHHIGFHDDYCAVSRFAKNPLKKAAKKASPRRIRGPAAAQVAAAAKMGLYDKRGETYYLGDFYYADPRFLDKVTEVITNDQDKYKLMIGGDNVSTSLEWPTSH